MRDVCTGVSVVVPVYNSSGTLSQLVEGIDAVLKGKTETHEIILVNDGSTDRSWEKISDLADQNEKVRGINLSRNYGQHNALLAGIREARLQVIVTMDVDLQHPPSEIPRLLDRLADGFDVVYGTPVNSAHGFWRRLGSSLTRLALRSGVGAETALIAGPFRAFRTEAREGFAHYSGPFVSIDVLLTWGAARFGAVPVCHDPRVGSKSTYTFRKLTLHALDMLTGFSTLPLQIASLVGLIFAFFGVVVLAVVLLTYFIHGGSVPGFPFLASVIAIFSGAQLLALGVMGQYLARMHFRMMGKPAYSIRERTGAQKGTHAGNG